MSSTKFTTQEKILQAAWALLEATPEKPVRMSDIAKAAGISRQALYLHYPTRAELLIATARHLDMVKDVDARLAASRAAKSGPERLDAYIEAWGNYIPEIWGIARAFLAMKDSDEAAAAAWSDRMAAMRHGCEAAVAALSRDGMLRDDLDDARAADLLWTLLSVRNWDHLRNDCGWPQDMYIAQITRTARAALLLAGR